jgi:hypothetical protein
MSDQLLRRYRDALPQKGREEECIAVLMKGSRHNAGYLGCMISPPEKAVDVPSYSINYNHIYLQVLAFFVIGLTPSSLHSLALWRYSLHPIHVIVASARMLMRLK